MKTISKNQAQKLIDKCGNIFTVTFIKKDGTKRVMNCRNHVKKHLKGGELKFDPKKKGLKVVFDMQKKAYRMVNVNSMVFLKINREELKINE